MLIRRIAVTACILAVLALAVAPAFGAASGEKVKNKGVITLRSGDTLTVKTSEGVFTVTINSDTKIQHPVGLTGMRKKQDSPDVLIPGLKMKFEGVSGAQENQQGLPRRRGRSGCREVAAWSGAEGRAIAPARSHLDR